MIRKIPRGLKTLLAVTQLKKNNSCRIAVIKGSRPDASARAHTTADGMARSFNCKSDTAKVISVVLTAVDQLLSRTPCPAE